MLRLAATQVFRALNSAPIQQKMWTGDVLAEQPRAAETMAEERKDDQDLLRKIGKGNAAAFSAFYARHQRMVYRFAWYTSENSMIAEEITQEVFMQLISKPSRYDPSKGSVAGYLIGIARNLARRSIAENPDHVPITEELLDSDGTGFASDADLVAELSRLELVETLRKAVLSLPEKYREVLILRDLEEISHQETADLLQCSLGTVASRLHRARAMVKMRLKNVGCLK